MNNTIIFSGLPATGKTTAFNGVKDLFSSQFLYVPEFLEPFPDWFSELGDNNLDGIKKSQEWVVRQHVLKKELAKAVSPRLVIMDRSVMDVLAFGWGFSEEVYEHTLKYVNEYNWEPGNVLFFDADIEEIKKRFILRGDANVEAWSSQWEIFMRRLREGYGLAKDFGEFNYHKVEANQERQVVLEGVTRHLRSLERV